MLISNNRTGQIKHGHHTKEKNAAALQRSRFLCQE